MEKASIDWNEAWKEQRSKRSMIKRDVRFWNEKAKYFIKDPWGSNYGRDFLKIMEPRRCWSVLDIACGTGTIALPLARYVRRVTAVDFSPKMLEALAEQCKGHGIENITAVNASWEDNWRLKGIEKHDVVVASRCLIVEDLQTAITKLNAFAKERVYTSTIVGDGPHDRRVYEAVGRKLVPGPDYIYNYNLLHQMGIYANITFITDQRQESFRDHDDAFDHFSRDLKKLTVDEKARLKQYLDEHLLYKNGKWCLDYKKSTRWAVIWWERT